MREVENEDTSRAQELAKRLGERERRRKEVEAAKAEKVMREFNLAVERERKIKNLEKASKEDDDKWWANKQQEAEKERIARFQMWRQEQPEQYQRWLKNKDSERKIAPVRGDEAMEGRGFVAPHFSNRMVVKF